MLSGPPSIVRRVWVLVTAAYLVTATATALLLWSPGLQELPATTRAEIQLGVWFAVFGITGAALMLGLRRLERWARAPLAGFEQQIRSLAERRYVEEQQPNVAEWIELSRSINVLVARVRHMLRERDEALKSLMERVEHDELTGVASRELFMATLKGRLRDADAEDGKAGVNTGIGGVAIVRVHDLDGMNRRVGRSRTDEFLVAIATALRARTHLWPQSQQGLLARLNGADFGLLLHGVDLERWREQILRVSESLASLGHEGFTEGADVAWIGATGYLQGESFSDVLARVDNMLLYAQGRQEPVCFAPPTARPALVTVAQWRMVIEQALDTGHLRLTTQPIQDVDGSTLHHAAELQLLLPDSTVLGAEEVLPPAVRSGRVGDLELKLVEMVLGRIRSDGQEIAVRLSLASVLRPVFLRQLGELLDSQPEALPHLRIELQEPTGNSAGLGGLQGLARVLEGRACQLGITHFGLQASLLSVLAAGQVRYVKLAPELLSLPDDVRGQQHLEQLWRNLSALGVQVYGEDTQSQYMLRTMLPQTVVHAPPTTVHDADETFAAASAV
jgi:EAL domain-containing protein (putative c-di-GMP-specific phosphodiesterase class I)/GGDEF domain-containing protein